MFMHMLACKSQNEQDWKTSVLKPEDKTVMTENGCFCDFYDFYDFYEF